MPNTPENNALAAEQALLGLLSSQQNPDPQPDPSTGIRLADGDTGYIDGAEGSFRLSKADTVEKSHPGKENLAHEDSVEAQQMVADLINLGARPVATGEKDFYGRDLTTLRGTNGEDLELEMVRAGVAMPTRDGESQQAELDSVVRRALGAQASYNPTINEFAQKASRGTYDPFKDAVRVDAPRSVRDKQGALSAGFERGIDDTQASLGGALNYLGDQFGIPEWSKKGRQIAEFNQMESGLNPRKVESFSDINSVGKAFDYALESMGEMGPGLILDGSAALLTGGGSLAASGVRRAFMGSVKNAASKGFITKEQAKTLRASFLAGFAASGGTQSLGMMENRLDEENEGSHGLASAASGVFGAALNTLPFAVIAGDVLKAAGLGKEVVQEVADNIVEAGGNKLLRDRLKDVGTTGLKAGALEGGTTLAQSVVDEAIFANTDDNEWELTTMQAIDNTIRGVIGGGALGSASSGIANATGAMLEYDAARKSAAAEQDAGFDRDAEIEAFRALYADGSYTPEGAQATARHNRFTTENGSKLSAEQVKSMLDSGALSIDDVKNYMSDNGFNPELSPPKEGMTQESVQKEAMWARAQAVYDAMATGDYEDAIAKGHLSESGAAYIKQGLLAEGTDENRRMLDTMGALSKALLSKAQGKAPELQDRFLADALDGSPIPRKDINNLTVERDYLAGYKTMLDAQGMPKATERGAPPPVDAQAVERNTREQDEQRQAFNDGEGQVAEALLAQAQSVASQIKKRMVNVKDPKLATMLPPLVEMASKRMLTEADVQTAAEAMGINYDAKLSPERNAARVVKQAETMFDGVDNSHLNPVQRRFALLDAIGNADIVAGMTEVAPQKTKPAPTVTRRTVSETEANAAESKTPKANPIKSALRELSERAKAKRALANEEVGLRSSKLKRDEATARAGSIRQRIGELTQIVTDSKHESGVITDARKELRALTDELSTVQAALAAEDRFINGDPDKPWSVGAAKRKKEASAVLGAVSEIPSDILRARAKDLDEGDAKAKTALKSANRGLAKANRLLSSAKENGSEPSAIATAKERVAEFQKKVAEAQEAQRNNAVEREVIADILYSRKGEKSAKKKVAEGMDIEALQHNVERRPAKNTVKRENDDRNTMDTTKSLDNVRRLSARIKAKVDKGLYGEANDLVGAILNVAAASESGALHTALEQAEQHAGITTDTTRPLDERVGDVQRSLIASLSRGAPSTSMAPDMRLGSLLLNHKGDTSAPAPRRVLKLKRNTSAPTTNLGANLGSVKQLARQVMPHVAEAAPSWADSAEGKRFAKSVKDAIEQAKKDEAQLASLKQQGKDTKEVEGRLKEFSAHIAKVPALAKQLAADYEKSMSQAQNTRRREIESELNPQEQAFDPLENEKRKEDENDDEPDTGYDEGALVSMGEVQANMDRRVANVHSVIRQLLNAPKILVKQGGALRELSFATPNVKGLLAKLSYANPDESRLLGDGAVASLEARTGRIDGQVEILFPGMAASVNTASKGQTRGANRIVRFDNDSLIELHDAINSRDFDAAEALLRRKGVISDDAPLTQLDRSDTHSIVQNAVNRSFRANKRTGQEKGKDKLAHGATLYVTEVTAEGKKQLPVNVDEVVRIGLIVDGKSPDSLKTMERTDNYRVSVFEALMSGMAVMIDATSRDGSSRITFDPTTLKNDDIIWPIGGKRNSDAYQKAQVSKMRRAEVKTLMDAGMSKEDATQKVSKKPFADYYVPKSKNEADLVQAPLTYASLKAYADGRGEFAGKITNAHTHNKALDREMLNSHLQEQAQDLYDSLPETDGGMDKNTSAEQYIEALNSLREAKNALAGAINRAATGDIDALHARVEQAQKAFDKQNAVLSDGHARVKEQVREKKAALAESKDQAEIASLSRQITDLERLGKQYGAKLKAFRELEAVVEGEMAHYPAKSLEAQALLADLREQRAERDDSDHFDHAGKAVRSAMDDDATRHEDKGEADEHISAILPGGKEVRKLGDAARAIAQSHAEQARGIKDAANPDKNQRARLEQRIESLRKRARKNVAEGKSAESVANIRKRIAQLKSKLADLDVAAPLAHRDSSSLRTKEQILKALDTVDNPQAAGDAPPLDGNGNDTEIKGGKLTRAQINEYNRKLRASVRPVSALGGIGKLIRSMRTRLERIHRPLADALYQRSGDGDNSLSFERGARLMWQEHDTEWNKAIQGLSVTEVNAAWGDARTGKPQTDAGKRVAKVIDGFISAIKEQNPSYKAKGAPIIFDSAKVNRDRAGAIAILTKHKIKNPSQLIEAILDGKGVPDMTLNLDGPSVHGGKGYTEQLRVAAKDLEAAGFLDLDGVTSMRRFLASGSALANWGRVFGAKDKGGNFDPNALYEFYLSQTAPEHLGEVRRMVRAVTGQLSHEVPAWINILNSASFALTAGTVLWFSGIMSIPEIGVAVGRSRGYIDGMGKDVFTYMGSASRKQKQQMAELFGTISPAVLREGLNAVYDSDAMSMGKVGRRITETVFYYNGQEFITRMTRTLATHWGRKFIEQTAVEALRGDATSIRMLKELGLDAQTVSTFVKETNANGGVPKLDTAAGKRVAQGMRRFVDESVSNPHAGQMPLWMSDTRWNVFSSLKKFFYAFWDNYHRSVFGEMSKRSKEGLTIPSVLAPFAISAAFMLPMAALSEILKEVWKYPGAFIPGLYTRKTPRSMGDYALSIAQNTGGLGPLQTVAAAYEQQGYGRNLALSMMGPTATFAFDMLSGKVLSEDPARVMGPANQTPWLRRPINKTWQQWIGEGGDE